MEDWYVSDSENDEGESFLDEPKPECIISLTLDKVFGGNIDSTKMIELLQRINLDKCLDLDCTSDYIKERQRKRTKRKRKKRDSFPDGEISETTSEMISTRTPSTGADCRDTRRPSLSAFEYEHEDFPALAGGSLSRKKFCPTIKKVAASTVPMLSAIEARIRDEEMISNEQETLSSEDEGRGVSPQRGVSSKEGVSHGPLRNGTSMCTSNGGVARVMTNGHGTIQDSVFDFGFDEDNDLDSSCDLDTSIFSKIRHIENFLDGND